MGRKAPKYAAYVVYRGKKPGVYNSWEECVEQVHGQSKNKYNGYTRASDAELAWTEWQKKLSDKPGASTFPQQASRGTANPQLESTYVPPARSHPTDARESIDLLPLTSREVFVEGVTPVANERFAERVVKAEGQELSPWTNSGPASYSELQAGSSIGRNFRTETQEGDPQTQLLGLPISSYNHPQPVLFSAQTKHEPASHNLTGPDQLPSFESTSPLPQSVSSFEQPSTYNTPPPSSSPTAANLKRPADTIEISDDESDFKTKRPWVEVIHTEHVLTREERFEPNKLGRLKKPTRAAVVEPRVHLTPEQDQVVNLAIRKNNIFMTGAAGSGKTTVLKEIMRKIKNRKKGGRVHVVAPTGIAALPLGGKTTYSFAGWNQNSFRKPLEELLRPRSSIVKTINELDVLVVEEISMVENHFLERLNLLFQKAMDNKKPFGGKQVLFLGDFHQLPPVLPFKFCMYCGYPIPTKGKDKPMCTSQKCTTKVDSKGNPIPQAALTWADKWAFKSSVWTDLKLRHIKLEQIHRQKSERFQDILNKIRMGNPLSPEEWHDLERPKTIPKDVFAVRLMSRLAQVKAFNGGQLMKLTSLPQTWKSNDAAEKLITKVNGREIPDDPYKLKEAQDSLRDHRFPADLTLKVGAAVVLLQNLDPDEGLVNGSQGVVVGFAPDPNEIMKIDEMTGNHKEYRKVSMMDFQSENLAQNPNTALRPVVRFGNGLTQLISSYASAEIRGGGDPFEQYVATRTQIPLALAWALSIHKSQGMTLEYVEVSSKDIFECGQLYVALSRATRLDGLRLLGFNRKQLPMDPDVLRFYTETKWEKLEGRGAEKG